MKTAFATWNDRIAPVFDTAQTIHVVEFQGVDITDEKNEAIGSELPVQKVLRLVELDIGVLVCGAVSRPVYDVLIAYGIHVIPFVAGGLPEIIDAYLGGIIEKDRFAMPGCRKQRRHRARGMNNFSQKEERQCQEEMERDPWEWDR
ncbi:MAG: NifB/NifX family molybdenum-iron cluster-binding protein [Desulfobacteraceae bacterium]|jgi:predicted Fe-Mo cluster-binding NifX family protein